MYVGEHIIRGTSHISHDKVEFKVYELDRERLEFAACFIIIWPAFFYNSTKCYMYVL